MDIRDGDFYNGPKKEVKVEKKIEEPKEETIVEENPKIDEETLVENTPKDEGKVEDKPKPTTDTIKNSKDSIIIDDITE